MARMVARASDVLGKAIYAVDQPKTLEDAVGRLLRDKELTLATAESCTAGLLAERLTRAPGSSDYFLGGLVTYSNRAKVMFLRVAAMRVGEGDYCTRLQFGRRWNYTGAVSAP